MSSAGSFLGGLFTGNNSTEQGDVNNAGNVAGFGIGAGEGAVSTGLGFEEGLLSGNQSEEGKLLAPEIQNIQQQGQQQIQTAGEFGTRSGGQNASAQQNIDTQRANVNNLISQLTGQAASGVTSAGENLLNTGLSANQQQANEEQQIMENQQNSIFGGLATRGVNDLIGAIPANV
jgi:hypothetical protein